MTNTIKLSFVDVFAGCGGLSLGLMQAGWKGLFAIEADKFAFETLKHNLLSDGRFSYDWPTWLPQEARNISGFIEQYKKKLKPLRGKVDLIVGGPPCTRTGSRVSNAATRRTHVATSSGRRCGAGSRASRA